MKKARSMFIFSVLLIMSSQLHFQNDQKNGALYLHGKLDMPTPPTKMNPATLTMKMSMTTIKTMLKVENRYHPDNHHPETNHNHLLPPNLHYGSTILKCVK
jgi:hypothetical protein